MNQMQQHLHLILKKIGRRRRKRKGRKKFREKKKKQRRQWKKKEKFKKSWQLYDPFITKKAL